MMYEYIIVYIVLPLIIITIIDFFVRIFFPYFFHVHLLSKLSRTHSKTSNNDFAKFKQCERVILRLG
jgi:hypothetical protein